MGTVLLLIVLFIAGAVGVVLWRGRQIGALARRGVETKARVTRRFKTGRAGQRRNRRLGFVYTGPDGKEYTRYETVTPGKFDEYREGDEITIVYLPENPGVSASKWLVDPARELLARKGKLGPKG
jgi:hypothetical protein